jgi:ribosomal protein S18 acetylase RimI-like enzyme
MLTYLIRPLGPADEHFLFEMLYHAIYVREGQASFPKEIVNEPEIARYALRWGRIGDQGFAAVEKPSVKPIGAVWIRLFTAENKGYGYVDEEIPELTIALLPEYRNQGIGTTLLNHLITEARHQHPALSLSVSMGNPAARLYRRLGFEVVKQVGHSLTMKKELGGLRDHAG